MRWIRGQSSGKRKQGKGGRYSLIKFGFPMASKQLRARSSTSMEWTLVICPYSGPYVSRGLFGNPPSELLLRFDAGDSGVGSEWQVLTSWWTFTRIASSIVWLSNTMTTKRKTTSRGQPRLDTKEFYSTCSKSDKLVKSSGAIPDVHLGKPCDTYRLVTFIPQTPQCCRKLCYLRK